MWRAGIDRSIREICEHVLKAQNWKMCGIQDGVAECRKRRAGQAVRGHLSGQAEGAVLLALAGEILTRRGSAFSATNW